MRIFTSVSSSAALRGGGPAGRRRSWAVVLSVLLTAASVTVGSTAAADVGTIAHDTLRTGWDSGSALTPSSVASSTFGKLFSATVNGQVYAQPLVIGTTVVTATENNAVYGLDSTTGAAIWSRSLGPSWPASTVSCGDLTPNIGVTSTPVYDAATNSIFLTSKTNDGPSAQYPHWYMHSLDLATGAERAGFPVMIQGAPTNDPTRAFNAMTAQQRPGLLLMNGVVYAGFASHCDYTPFVGYIVGVSTSGRQTTMWATESGNSNAEGGIWQSGGGLVSDGAGQILFSTGNGISPSAGPGKTPPATLAESVVRLQVGADGNLTPTDFFSPAANVKMDQNDADLGSGAPVAIPDGYGTTAHPHLMVQAGKDGHVYLLDRDSLGGMAQGPGGTDAILDTAGPYNGVWGRPAFLGTSSGGYLYDVESYGYLRAFKLVPSSTGGVSLSAVATSSGTFGYTSGAPVVTSSGTDASTALVWVVYASGSTGTSAELRAYNALPDSTGHLQQVFSAPLGTASKFSSPATDGAHVYVGTRDGHILAFGAPTTAAVGATNTDLGTAPVGGTGTGTVIITASRDVTISSIATAVPFGVGTSLTLPQTMTSGGSLAVPVTFAPTVAGQANGTLTVKTADGETDLLGVHAIGTKDGLGSTPAAVSFTDVPTQTISRQTVNIVNTGTTAVTITGLTLPANQQLTVAPDTAPTIGQQIQPLASIPVSITFTPTAAGQITDSLAVASDLGSVTVPITASAVSGASHLALPSSLDFGDVPVGLSATRTFQIQNTGNVPMTITKAKAPQGVFSTTTPISEGLVIPPGDSALQSVSFTPGALGQAGTTATFYEVTADDGTGAHEVMLTGNGTDDPIAVYAQKIGAGSAGSPLGRVMTVEYPVGPGKCQDYTAGVICWSPTTGVHEVHGSIYARYKAAGGAGGSLGFPTTDEMGTPDGIGRYNHFAGSGGASIYWTSALRAHIVQGAIRAKWASLGWEAGPLGYPVTDETAAADGIGRYNHFSRNASIYWTPTTGAHSVQGGIRTEWASLGWEEGLGYPTTDETGTPDGVGRYNHFSRSASIYWTPATGAHAVKGAIRAKWASLGWEAGPLGYPLTDERTTPDGIGRYNHFSRNASIYWTPTTGAHSVQGAIRTKWASLGWERSRLGYPVTDEYTIPAGRESDFRGGRITWNKRTGTVSVF
ncbi:choice-of-anchor D domain-containing protein [Paenarthrobacter sp. DKR-5]|uniref:choice-of-anchor D domain-containing protein n=1 Tax=Paenarthrobacter sp. DKR-5 TaxID=2835535 RepID=UPI001BDC8631|nr:choice-of-anchor D domain-containing protein [Paenarthrobacter sp. DKR-5]MBT1001677.1 choice-of-anchor D domain-containing protein [Paenarthrobacter sp. DKR-5]